VVAFSSPAFGAPAPSGMPAPARVAFPSPAFAEPGQVPVMTLPAAAAVVAPPRVRPAPAVQLGETPVPPPVVIGETPAPQPVQLGETPVPVEGPPWAPGLGEVGYAPPAPVEPVRMVTAPGQILTGAPSTRIPTLTVPPPPPAAPPPGPPPAIAAPPVVRIDPKTGLPLETVTKESETEKQTFQVPGTENIEQRMHLRELGIVTPESATAEQVQQWYADEARRHREKTMTDADVQRLRRGGTETENKADLALLGYLNQVNKLLEAFPDPAERATYIGGVRRRVKEQLERIPGFSDPRFQQWQTLVSPFGEKLFDRAGAALTETELSVLRPLLPTGEEVSPAQFEWRLQNFTDELTARVAVRTAWRQLPVEQQTGATYEALLQQLRDQRAAARQQTFAPPPGTGSVTITPTSRPPQEAAAAPGLRQELAGTFIPERPFTTELPSVALATAGGTAGALTGPLAPIAVPVLAGLGGAVGEAGRVGYEQLTGTPPAEAGTLGERMLRAGTRSVAGEAVGPLVRGGTALVRGAVQTGARLAPAATAAGYPTIGWALRAMPWAAQALPAAPQIATPWLRAGLPRAAQQTGTALILPPAQQPP
jgi:hypothetical protein